MRQQALSFKEKEGTLFYISAGGTKLFRVVVSESEKERLMKACHCNIDGGHFRRDKTAGKVCLASLATNSQTANNAYGTVYCSQLAFRIMIIDL